MLTTKMNPAKNAIPVDASGFREVIGGALAIIDTARANAGLNTSHTPQHSRKKPTHK